MVMKLLVPKYKQGQSLHSFPSREGGFAIAKTEGSYSGGSSMKGRWLRLSEVGRVPIREVLLWKDVLPYSIPPVCSYRQTTSLCQREELSLWSLLNFLVPCILVWLYG